MRHVVIGFDAPRTRWHRPPTEDSVTTDATITVAEAVRSQLSTRAGGVAMHARACHGVAGSSMCRWKGSTQCTHCGHWHAAKRRAPPSRNTRMATRQRCGWRSAAGARSVSFAELLVSKRHMRVRPSRSREGAFRQPCCVWGCWPRGGWQARDGTRPSSPHGRQERHPAPLMDRTIPQRLGAVHRVRTTRSPAPPSGLGQRRRALTHIAGERGKVEL
mmetsp:Transcript_45001/g.101643  ORF Transcript_45001/g.101643 Transcript_45001/m.101643 type:complete len:217 (-) Transcript_45001:747-1397(-)